MTEKIQKSDDEWKQQLTPDQYAVTRRQGTEPAFSGAYCHHKADGAYHCVCCDAPLFLSQNKFDSGTGWPSFTQPANADATDANADHTHGMTRVEVTCRRCNAHLGHVFDDGPPETGQRFCINSLALEFKEKAGDK